MRSEFLSRLDAGVLGVHPRAEVAEGRRAGADNASAALLAWLCQ